MKKKISLLFPFLFFSLEVFSTGAMIWKSGFSTKFTFSHVVITSVVTVIFKCPYQFYGVLLFWGRIENNMVFLGLQHIGVSRPSMLSSQCETVLGLKSDALMNPRQEIHASKWEHINTPTPDLSKSKYIINEIKLKKDIG